MVGVRPVDAVTRARRRSSTYQWSADAALLEGLPLRVGHAAARGNKRRPDPRRQASATVPMCGCPTPSTSSPAACSSALTGHTSAAAITSTDVTVAATRTVLAGRLHADHVRLVDRPSTRSVGRRPPDLRARRNARAARCARRGRVWAHVRHRPRARRDRRRAGGADRGDRTVRGGVR